MGSWFSNIHIRKGQTATEEAATQYICKQLAAQQYLPVATESDADGAVAIICDEDHQWMSVYSDLLSFEDPQLFEKVASPMSAQLHTDVLGISCFDSDYLFLNLINSDEKIDAWLGIGSAKGLGIKRRSGLAAWKNKVTDFLAFSKAAKEKYDFAEEFLGPAESCLGIPELQSSAGYAYLQDLELDQKAKFLFFKLADEKKTKEPTKLVPLVYSGMPCFLDKPSVVDCINVGGESRGLSVYFLGSYVEHEEITFSDVCFVKWKSNQTQSIPFSLSKVQLPDGQWAYYYHDPGFRIPPKVDGRILTLKRIFAQDEHRIIVRFVPHGNPRKILDITVVFVPDKNPEGRTGWNVWHRWGSKKAFLEEYNKTWEKPRKTSPNPDSRPPILQEEDFD